MNRYKKKVAVINLGCKVNRFDWQQIAAQLDEQEIQFVPAQQEADLYVVNSCTVTHRSGAGSLKALRKIARENAGKPIIFTGCHASVAPESVKGIAPHIWVRGNDEKADLPRLIGQILQQPDAVFSAPQPVVHGANLQRPVLRVQDGCDQHCRYCIIPQARGPSRSFAVEWVLEQVRAATARSVPELVLTGIHLGDYGKGLDASMDLAGLVQRILDDTELPRLRLSSIEPPELRPALVDLVCHDPRICRYVHIPIQSGSDKILAAMNRPYDSASVRDLITDLHTKNPRVAVGADVIVGFPGEDEADFGASFALCESLNIAYLHVFPFSPRPGTPAATMRPFVPQRIATKRAAALRDLSERKRRAFYQAQLGTEFDVVIERRSWRPGYKRGTSDHYLDVHVQTNVSPGTLLRVRLLQIEPEALAEVVPAKISA